MPYPLQGFVHCAQEHHEASFDRAGYKRNNTRFVATIDVSSEAHDLALLGTKRSRQRHTVDDNRVVPARVRFAAGDLEVLVGHPQKIAGIMRVRIRDNQHDSHLASQRGVLDS